MTMRNRLLCHEAQHLLRSQAALFTSCVALLSYLVSTNTNIIGVMTLNLYNILYVGLVIYCKYS